MLAGVQRLWFMISGNQEKLALSSMFMILLALFNTLNAEAKVPDEHWRSKCVSRFNQRAEVKAEPKAKLTCVNSLQELQDRAFSDDDYAYTKLALTGIKFLNFNPELIMNAEDPANGGQKVDFNLKYKSGFKLDSCSMAYGKYNSPVFDWAFCPEERGYSSYSIGSAGGEGSIRESTYGGKKTFVAQFLGQTFPVSVCIRENLRKLKGGIAPGPVLTVVFDLERFKFQEQVGKCFFLHTGPVAAKNWLNRPEGSIMQAGVFPNHPIPVLRSQEVVKLYPDLPIVPLKKKPAQKPTEKP